MNHFVPDGGSVEQDPKAISHYSLVDGELKYKWRLVVGSKSPIHIDNRTQFHASLTDSYSRCTKGSPTFLLKKDAHSDVERSVVECDVCQWNMEENVASPSLLQTLTIPDHI